MAAKGSGAKRFNSALLAVPALATLLLALPCLRWPFLWDDYEFLQRSQSLRLGDLLPNADVTFYRPLSREIYFWIAAHVLGSNSLATHLLNALVGLACVYFLMDLLKRVAGARAALYGGLILATSAALPFVIGWVSGVQDLLGTAFTLLALTLAFQGRVVPAILAMAAAVFSKETAVVASPALIALSVLRDDGKLTGPRTRALAAGIALLLLLWAAVHPWTLSLLHHSDRPGGTEYVAFQGARVSLSLLHGMMSVANVTWDWRLKSPGWILAIALAVTLVEFWAIREAAKLKPSQQTTNTRWIGFAGAILLLGPLTLTAALIGHWSPYYGLMSVAGLALLA